MLLNHHTVIGAAFLHFHRRASTLSLGLHDCLLGDKGSRPLDLLSVFTNKDTQLIIHNLKKGNLSQFF